MTDLEKEFYEIQNSQSQGVPKEKRKYLSTEKKKQWLDKIKRSHVDDVIFGDYPDETI